MCYEFKINEIINILFVKLLDLFEEIFNKLRLVKREKIDDIIVFIIIIIKTRYDSKHFAFNLK